MPGSLDTMRRLSQCAVAMLIALSLFGAAVFQSAAVGAGLSSPTPIQSPARAGSREPNLATLPDGRVVMSWLEPLAGTRMALRCATYDGTRWSKRSTIAAG